MVHAIRGLMAVSKLVSIKQGCVQPVEFMALLASQHMQQHTACRHNACFLIDCPEFFISASQHLTASLFALTDDQERRSGACKSQPEATAWSLLSAKKGTSMTDLKPAKLPHWSRAKQAVWVGRRVSESRHANGMTRRKGRRGTNG